jgi:chromosomal replication initiator protein
VVDASIVALQIKFISLILRPRPFRCKAIEDRIIDAVSLVCNVPVFDMKRRTREKEIVRARQLAIYFMCNDNEFINTHTLKYIGTIFGGLNHATVIHSRDTITNELTYDKYLALTVEEIKTYINRND